MSLNLRALAAALERYRRNDTLGVARVAADNVSRFRELARFAVEHSPYYKRIVSEHGIDVDRALPDHFPQLTKSDLVREFDQIVTTRQISTAKACAFFAKSKPGTLFADRYYLMYSSGSSGTRAIVAIDRDDCLAATAVSYRFYRWRGPRRSAMLVRKSIHFPSTTIGASTRLLSPAGESIILDLAAPLAELVGTLNEFQPHLLSSYAGVVMRLAHEQRLGRLRIAPADVQVGGEILYPGQRRVLEETFAANVIDVYASCECLYMGWRTSGMPHMQLLHDNLMFEVHHDHVLCTTLCNRVLPLIRYRFDDHLDADVDGPAPTVRAIKGRIETAATFKTLSGGDAELCSLLPWSLVQAAIRDEIVAGAQLAVLADDHIDCRVVLTPHGVTDAAEVLRRIADQVRDLVRSQEFDVPRVSACVVTELATNPITGKIPALIDLRTDRPSTDAAPSSVLA